MEPRKETPPPARLGMERDSRSVARTEERSAGGVVVRVTDGEPRVLLIRDPYGKWGLPKGHLEEGEGDEEAAIREVAEETGLEDVELGTDLGQIDWTFRRQRRLVHKFCRFYLMFSAEGEARPELAEGITECRWLPLGDAMRTVAYENARVILGRAAEHIEGAETDEAVTGGEGP